MKLNKLAFSLLGAWALALPALAGPAPAKNPAPVAPPPEEEELGFTLSAGYDSHYIFRGVEYAEHWISTGLALDVPLVDNISLNLDANFGATAGDNSVLQDFDLGSYERLELGAGITADAGFAEVGLGYRWYHHMGDLNRVLEDGHEVGLTLAKSIGPVNVGLGSYYDFAVEGWYFEAAVNSEIKLTDSISLVPGVGIGYGVDYNYHVERFHGIDGFTAVNVSLALPIKLCKSATVTPYIAGNLPIDALDDLGEDNQLYGGVSLSVRF